MHTMLSEADHHENFSCHTAPINVSQFLQNILWERAHHGIVLCSATIRALGKFDDMRRKTGLKDNARLREVALASPFDYQRATLQVPRMQFEPKSAHWQQHLQEALALLPKLILPTAGTLVLFTSTRAMQMTYEHLPDALRQNILMQGQFSKQQLLAKHQQRIQRGGYSVLFGLTSFGEGIDLPAKLCQHVIIHKLPFAVPSTPVERTRNDWLSANQLSAFQLSSLPATSVRLTQFVGRLLRHENDHGLITILDKRLYTKQYGKALLQNLPPFHLKINLPIDELMCTTTTE